MREHNSRSKIRRDGSLTNGEALRAAIKDAGVTITFLAERMECSRNRVYSIIAGADCTATEIAAFTSLLHLSRELRDYIFLHENVN